MEEKPMFGMETMCLVLDLICNLMYILLYSFQKVVFIYFGGFLIIVFMVIGHNRITTDYKE